MPRVTAALKGFLLENRMAKLVRALGISLEGLRRARRLSTAGRSRPEDFFPIVNEFSQEAFRILGMDLKVEGEPYREKPCLLVANHISYIDILAFYHLLPCVFVAKQEVRHWPIFGLGAASIGTLFVKRNSNSSRQAVSEAIVRGIQEEGKSIVVFPEGTSSIEGKPWRRGIFALAARHGIPIQPVRIGYRPTREVAFINDDDLARHLWRLMGVERPMEASLHFMDPVFIKDLDADAARVESTVKQSYQLYYQNEFL